MPQIRGGCDLHIHPHAFFLRESSPRLSATLISEMWRRREIDVGLATVPAELGTRMFHSIRCLDSSLMKNQLSE
jgi:hypothetical protein